MVLKNQRDPKLPFQKPPPPVLKCQMEVVSQLTEGKESLLTEHKHSTRRFTHILSWDLLRAAPAGVYPHLHVTHRGLHCLRKVR